MSKYITNYDNISQGSGEVFFDAIFQKIYGEYYDFDRDKMNKYSLALRIEAGKVFDSVDDWLKHIKGQKLIVCIKHDEEKKRDYASYYRPYAVDEELQENESIREISDYRFYEYKNADDMILQRISIFLREVIETKVEESPF